MMRKLSILVWMLAICGTWASAQVEQVVNLQYRFTPLVQWKQLQALKQRQADTISLPFIDDFSYNSQYPDTTVWVQRQVYVNDDYPTNKLSYGVATFDGVNEIGVPYRTNVNSPTEGGADTLTSKPIDLSALLVSDNVILSFAYQPMGLGDYPDRGDSLILEFSLDDTTWVNVWGADGFNSRPADPQFTEVFILLDDLFYFRNDFRFRFRNRATITGNNDHWHLDYVYLNSNRTDSVLQDISVLNKPTSFLKNYTMMPWKQFEGHETSEVDSSVTLCYRNNYPANTSIDFRYQAFSQLVGQPQAQLFASSVFNYNSLPTSDSCFTFSSIDYVSNLPDFDDNDSVLVSLKTFVNTIGGDISRSNDTVVREVEFFNLLAYDDGTAEKGYGLAGASGLKRFAMEFNLNEPDTLRAVLMHFTRINDDVSNELFSFFIWKSLDLQNNGATEDTLYYVDFQRPTYVDSLNGFATFALPEPLLVDGTFYVGWQQISEENIQVGMDIQNSARQHMYYFATNTWFASQIDGAPMIRPLFGKDVPLVGIIEPTKRTNELTGVKVFPNPTTSQLFIDLPQTDEVFVAKVYDLQGRLVAETTVHDNSIVTDGLQAGMYVLHVADSRGTFTRTARFVKY